MFNSDVRSLLAIGIDLVSLASSAKRAGYQVYAADYFGDLDLQHICIKYKSIVRQKPAKSCGRFELDFKPEAFLPLTKSLLQENEIDAVLLSSGLDDYFDIFCELNDLVPILGNSSQTVKNVREKPKFFEELKHLGIPHPETAIVTDVKEAIKIAAEIEYPVVLKPSRGFGGIGIRIAKSPQELRRAFQEVLVFDDNILIQKHVIGAHISISFLASHNVVKILTINEQLIGVPYTFQSEPFGYCGNIVPFHSANLISGKCEHITRKIALHFGLIGSNGIDLVISKENVPYVIEINPRFQGTLECVERVLGINLVKAHVNACLHGSLPTVRRKNFTFSTRLILFAPKQVIVPDLTIFKEVRDIPFPKTVIEKGEPLCSIVTESSRNDSLQKAKKIAKVIYRTLSPVSNL
ncbi:MAG: ATP-grasp domain-containing protein [Candidatus Bathyarchaeota archaeon]|nr:ATP-grasp domain-containing protein [Candidatus Bathyarchaeota archaeon]MDH5595352.1 ATP-grasp domain-containing protein [Candidatus Bathyarchaeota archaeon]